MNHSSTRSVAGAGGWDRFALGLILGLAILGLSACAGSYSPDDPAPGIALARDRVFPALVNIDVVTVRYWGGQEKKGRGTGSGTIISPQGYVLTNYHVTRDGHKYTCTLADKQQIPADLVGEDPLTDLAVLRLRLSERRSEQPLAVAQFGDSDALQVGEQVMSMGSPLSLSRSVTLGIVSNTQRVFAGGLRGDDDDMELEPGQTTGLFTRWIQHDALIQPGNSGGPLVNMRGQVVGVNELGGSGIGFAIPSNLARQVTEALMTRGRVPRSWIGITFKPIERTGYEQGVLINSLVRDGPAALAGLQPGDLLLALDGQPVTVRFNEEAPLLLKRLADLPIGSTLKVSYQRDGKRSETRLVTQRFAEDRGQQRALRTWGLTAEEITPRIAQELRLADRSGAIISSTRRGGPAQLAEPPLNAGDVVRKIDNQPIADLGDLVNQYRRIDEQRPRPERILIHFDRQGRSEITVIKPKPDRQDDPPREVPKAWLGVATQPVLPDIALKLGFSPEQGVGYRITRIYPGTLAARSDLKTGDIITHLNGKRLRPRGMQDAGQFALQVRQLDIDSEIKLTVWRDGQSVELAAVLERTRITPTEAITDFNRDFELTVREMTFFDRDEQRWDTQVQGVIVADVEGAGWAGLGGLRPGDLIQRIDGRDIVDLATYRAALDSVIKAQPDRVVFVVLRGSRTGFHYLEPEWKPAAADPSTSPATAPAAGPG